MLWHLDVLSLRKEEAASRLRLAGKERGLRDSTYA